MFTIDCNCPSKLNFSSRQPFWYGYFAHRYLSLKRNNCGYPTITFVDLHRRKNCSLVNVGIWSITYMGANNWYLKSSCMGVSPCRFFRRTQSRRPVVDSQQMVSGLRNNMFHLLVPDLRISWKKYTMTRIVARTKIGTQYILLNGWFWIQWTDPEGIKSLWFICIMTTERVIKPNIIIIFSNKFHSMTSEIK